MTRMPTLRRSSGILAAAVAAVTAVGLQAGPAQAHPVGPKQYFTGVINGKDGNTTIPITITMNCPGPGRPGRTGHPLAGQTLAVHQLFPLRPVPAATHLAHPALLRNEDSLVHPDTGGPAFPVSHRPSPVREQTLSACFWTLGRTGLDGGW
jgi:hypothetical protein